MKLVFDIGYNYGEFSKACTLKHKDCKIIGLEANPGLANLGNQPKNVTIINKLVSTKSGNQVPFYINPYHEGISTASLDFMENSRFNKGSKYIPNPKQTSTWVEPINVESITLDDLIKDYGTPDFIKIDVEGYEKEVIQGLTQLVPFLGFEWHEEEHKNILKIVDYLQNLGFTKFGVVGFFEGELNEKITFSSSGDPYMDFPKNFYSWEELKPSFEDLINPERRVHFGMFYAKK